LILHGLRKSEKSGNRS